MKKLFNYGRSAIIAASIALASIAALHISAAYATYGTNAPNWATTSQAQTGTDTTHVMNPALTKSAIKALVPGHTVPGPASGQNPTGTTSATGVMMGLGSNFTLTTVKSSYIMVLACGDLASTNSTASMTVTPMFGIGTAATNGAAQTSNIAVGVSNVFKATVASTPIPFCVIGVANPALGSTAWFDIAIATTAGTATATNVSIMAWEL